MFSLLLWLCWPLFSASPHNNPVYLASLTNALCENRRHADKTWPIPDWYYQALCVCCCRLYYVSALWRHPQYPPHWRVFVADIYIQTNSYLANYIFTEIFICNSPAVFIKCQHITFILNARHGIMITMSRGIHLIAAFIVLSSLFGVFRPIVP